MAGGAQRALQALFRCSRLGYSPEIVMRLVPLVTSSTLGLIGNVAVIYAALETFGPLNLALYGAASVLTLAFWLAPCSPGA